MLLESSRAVRVVVVGSSGRKAGAGVSESSHASGNQISKMHSIVSGSSEKMAFVH